MILNYLFPFLDSTTLASDSLRQLYALMNSKLNETHSEPFPYEEVMGMSIPLVLFIVAAVIVYFYFNHRQKTNLAMIEKGMNPYENKKIEKPLNKEGYEMHQFRFLKNAITLIAVGLGIFIGLIISKFTDFNHGLSIAFSILLFLGIGMLLLSVLTKKAMNKEK